MVASLKGQLLNRWLGVRLDASGIALVTAVCLASTLSAGSLDPGLVGLILSYALTVSGSSASGGRGRGCGAPVLQILCALLLVSSQPDGAVLFGHGDAAIERRAHPALCPRKWHWQWEGRRIQHYAHVSGTGTGSVEGGCIQHYAHVCGTGTGSGAEVPRGNSSAVLCPAASCREASHRRRQPPAF